MNSGFFKLDFKDLGKGLLLAVLVAVLQLVLNLLQSKGLSISVADLQGALDLAVKAGAAYLIKNLLSDQQGNPLGIGSK